MYYSFRIKPLLRRLISFTDVVSLKETNTRCTRVLPRLVAAETVSVPLMDPGSSGEHSIELRTRGRTGTLFITLHC
jgi:hypothetical protein